MVVAAIILETDAQQAGTVDVAHWPMVVAGRMAGDPADTGRIGDT
jgi:hypothetical protein